MTDVEQRAQRLLDGIQRRKHFPRTRVKSSAKRDA